MVEPEVVPLPEELFKRRSRRTSSEAIDIIKRVAELPEKDAVRLHVSGMEAARIKNQVRNGLSRRGYKLITRTDGFGNLYLARGEKIDTQ